MSSMKNIRLLLEYDGTAYHGWQVQKGVKTIQGILEDSIFRITGRQAPVIGASRTDAGVHALGQVAVFRAATALDAGTIRRALNALLPQDIRVVSAVEIHDPFHPRDDAVRKRYFYMISNQNISSAFLFRYTWIVPQQLDIRLMESAAQVIVGRHDFSAFRGTGSDVKDPVREIYDVTIDEIERISFMEERLPGNFIKITAEANGFLRHMVRNIVGTLVEVGRGRIPVYRMKEILESGNRQNAGQTAPASGLFLERIEY
jgi:tRNA pseudouridine38-40 synthase